MANSEIGKSKFYSRVNFPARSNLKLVNISTLILVFLMTGVSVIGILFQSAIYPSKELSVVFVPNDILNLVIGLPLILVSLFLTKRGKLIGLSCYPAALFYITYIYTGYLLGLPFNVLFIPYLILVTLSIYTLIGLVLNIDSEQVRKKLKGYVPIKTAGVIYQSYQIVNTFVKHLEVEQMMMAQWIDDLVIASPPLLLIGFYMIRGKALGYSMGMGLLLVLTILFIGLVPILIIKGILTGTPINVPDILLVAGSSMICFIPFLLFAKGIIRTSKTVV